MKVLMVDQWLPNQPYALDLCRKLAAYAEVTLCTPKYFQPEQEPFRCRNILESKVKEKKLGLLSYLWGVFRLAGAAMLGRYEVLHIQSFKKQALEMKVFRLVKRLTGKKIVYTAHNILPHERGNRKEAEQLKQWYDLCDAIVVHNEHSRQTLIGFAPEAADKIQVIPHGTFNDFVGMAREEKHDKTVFLLFGMIRKYKGIDDLLKAASLLPAEYRKRFQIIIAGNQRKDLDNTDYQAMLSKYGLEDFVKLSNSRVPDEQVPELFNKSDCCLFPYKEIYGSGALLMAYSFEKPVIVSGIPTFIEETDQGATGLIYDREEERGLTDALIRFAEMTETEKQTMKENIRRLCKTKYNWDVSAKTLASVYETAGKSGKKR